MHILTLSTLFPNSDRPNFGIFVERQTASLAAQDNVKVTVINPIGIAPWPISIFMPSTNKHLVSNIASDWRGLKIFRPSFPLIPKFGGPVNPHFIASAILPIIKKIHAQSPIDVIDAEFFYPDGPAAMIVAEKLNIPYTIKARGADVHLWGSKFGCKNLWKKAADNAVHLFAVSGALKRDIVAYGVNENKITVHYTGLDRNKFHPSTKAGQLPDILTSKGGNAPYLLSVGALIERKGQSFVIDAVASLPKHYHYVLAGSGPDEAALRAQAASLGLSDRVTFLGNVDNEDLPSLYQHAFAMVLPTASEGLANAWVESIGCGTPIITCNVGGAEELVRGPDSGYLIERSADAIVDAVNLLAKNRATPAAIAEQAAQFSWHENGRLLAKYFKNIVGINQSQ
ncbi:hypothetical protein LPB140_06570 [Sphingorhabdus lutea]|uniref:Glycosyltransferase family 4 protein n=1 Tax=Sphingorhabdus lutea TaxID=1913578 RepID=A0A1L3JBK7_9SPHN|nr:glycosyltransferase [Sphingorhabdus lutea]APG62506.1 hypothetical protein LPB140_06570 [Sphingorhabdus lutea]